MATDADIVIPLPVCEARAEQLENVVDSIVKISVSEVPQENQDIDDNRNELPMIKGENFLKSPLTNEVHSEANGVAPDASKVVESADESQQNVEVSNNKDDDEDRGVVPEKCSMGDTIDACHTDDATGVTHLSKEKSNDHHGTYGSSTDNVALAKEILLESSLMSEETESHTPCISESEKLSLQSKLTDDKSTNGKPTEEDLSSNLTYKMTLYPEPIENETSVEYDFNTTAEKASHEDISPQEMITALETSNSDKLESKSELNTPLPKEEETVAQKGDKSVTAQEDHGVTSNKTLSESHGDVECQSQTLEDVEKFEESSPVQVEDLQIERDEQFEEESERLPLLTKVSTEGPVDNVALEAMDNVKDRDKDPKEVELSENEQNTSTLVKEDAHKENLAESFHVSPENIQVSDLSQEDSVKAPPEEQSRNVTLHGDTIKENEATINADDRHKESLEIFPTIVLSSHEGASMNAGLQEDTNVHTNGKIIEEVDNHKEVLEKTDQTSKDGLDTLLDRPVELAENEDTSAKENQKSTEESNNTDKYGDIDAVSEVCSADSSVAISEIKVGDTLVDPDMGNEKVVTQLSKDTNHGTNDSFTEDVALTDEILQKTEPHTPCISEGSKDKESNIQVITTDNKSVDEKPAEEDILCNLTNEVSKEGEPDHNKKIIDEVDKHKEVSENLSTTVSTEDAEGNSLVELEGSETKKEDDLEKESDETPLPLPLALEVSDASKFLHEASVEDEEPKKAEFCADEMDAESMPPKTESITEGDVHLDSEDTKVPDSVDKISEGGTVDAKAGNEENVENVPIIIPNEKAEKNLCIHVDGQETENEQLSSINDYPANASMLQNVSNEDSDKDLLIKVAESEMTHDINLEEELDTPSLTKPSKDEASDNESILLKPKTSNKYASKVELLNDEKSTDCTTPKKESLQPQDHKTPTSSAARETTCSVEEQSLGENSQTIISVKLIDEDAAENHDLTLENVATETPHEHIEENAVTQVGCSVGKHEESMEEDNQSSSLIEAPPEETNVMESKNIDEPKNWGEESIKPDLENGENTESIYVKEETDVETPIDSLQVKPDDIKQHDSISDINKSIEEETSNSDPQEISTNKVERKSVDATHANEENVETKDVTKDIPDYDKEDKIPIEEVGSQNPLNEALAGNANDEESTKITEDCLITKEEPLESLQVADQDIETPPSSQDREIGSLDKESPTTNLEAITDDNKEEIPNNTTREEDEMPNDKDIIENISEYGKEDNMPFEEVGSQNPPNGASTENANIEESPKINECSLIKEEAPLESLQEAAQEIETFKITEGSLIREEASLESLQEAAQEIETTHLSQEREISSPNEQMPLEGIKDDNTEEIADSETSLEVETNHEHNIANTPPYEDEKVSMQVQEDCSQREQNESKDIPSLEAPAVPCTESSTVKEEERVEIPTEKQILNANPVGTYDETHESTVGAANKNNDVIIRIPNGDIEDNAQIEVDGLQKQSSEEVPAQKINDDQPTTTHEVELANENTVKANLNENEEKLECSHVNEEVYIELLQVADEDFTDNSSGQDRKPSHFEEKASTKDSQETMGDERYAKPFDSTDLKQETLEDKNNAATPDEDNKEDSRDKVDDLLLKQEEHSSTSSSDAPKDEITESTWVKEEAEDEDPVDSSQVATEDIKAFAPCQDTEISSTADQIIDLKDISSNKITEKTVDATDKETQETQDTAKSVSQEYDSLNEQNTEAILIKEDVSIGVPRIVGEESSPVQEEEKLEIPTEEQILTVNPQGTCDETQEITVDADNYNNDVVISIPNGENEDNSPIEMDGLQEHSSEEVPAEKINDDEPTTTYGVESANENAVKANLNENEEKLECSQVKEVHIKSLQVADEDVKDTSGQDRKPNHFEEQGSTKDSHETMGDDKYSKTFDSTDLKQETPEDENYSATPDEDTKEYSRNQVDDLLMEREAHSVKDSGSTSVSDAPNDYFTGSTLAKEVAEVEDPIDSSHVATEDIKAFAPCKESEISPTVEQIIDPKDISSNKITEKPLDATGEESQVAQDIAESVPWEDNSPNEQNTEATLIKEDQSIELPRVLAEAINDNEKKTTIDPTIFENETPKNEVPKEMETVDVKEETKKEECYLKVIQMTTAVIVASNQERSLNLTAKETPCTEDLNVNKVIIGHIPEVSNDKQQDSPVMKVPEENMMTSNEHVLDGNSMESGVSEKSNDQVDREANICGDKTDLEKIEVLNDGPLVVPTSQTLAEIESRGRTVTEVQVPNREKEAEFKQETENDQTIEKAVPNYAASENASELKEVNGVEEIAANKCAEILHSPISVASEDVSTSNVALEEDSTSNTDTHLETKNVQEASAIKQTTPLSTGQDAESISEENSNYVCSSTEEKSDLNEVAFMPGENKSGLESSNRGLESVAQDQRCGIISKTEETKTDEEDLKAEAEIQSDKGVTENILKEETTCEEETRKEDISREKEQKPRIKEEHEDIKDYHQVTKNGNDAETVPEVSEEATEKALEEVEEKIFANEAIERIIHQEEQPTSIEEPTAKIDYENPHDLDIACVNTDTQDSNKEAAQTTIIPRGENEKHNKEDEISSSDEMQVKDEEHLILSQGKNKEEAKETYKEAGVEDEKFDLSSQTKDISECAISDVGQETPEGNEKYTTEKSSGEDDPIKTKECEVSSASEDIKLTEQSSEDASIIAQVQEAKAGTDLGAAVPAPEATGIESQEMEELNDKCTEMADASTPDETSVMTASNTIGESTEGDPLEARDQQTKDIALTEQLSEGACITAEVQEAKDGIYLRDAVPVPGATGSERQEVEELNDKRAEMADTSAPVESSEISLLYSIGESTERTTLEAKDQQTKLRDFQEELNTRHIEVKMAGIDDAMNLQSVSDTGDYVQDQELCKESFGMSNNQNPVEGDPEESAETSEGNEENPSQAAPVSETLEQEIEEQKLGRDTVDVHEEETNISNIPNQLESVCGADTEKLPESSIHQSSVENTDQCDKAYTDQCDKAVHCSQQEQNEGENIPSLEAPAVSCTESSPVLEEEKVENPTEEHIHTANPQGNDETQEKTDDAANKNTDVVISIPNGDNEDNSPIEVDGLQEHSSEEVPAEKIKDDEPTTTHGVESANENAVKANMNENEEKLECSHANEEVYIESLQVEDEDCTDTSSGQDRKSRHLEEQASTEDSHETIGDERYAKTFDSTYLKQETLEDENYAANPDEDTKEDTRDLVDNLLLEKEEHLDKDSECSLLSDGPRVDITESTLVKEVAEVEDPMDSSQVATKNIKAFDTCQDTEISSTVERIIDSKDMPSNKKPEKTVDVTGKETQEAQDIAKSVPREYDSSDGQNTEAILIKENASTELPRIVAEESIPVQEEEKVEIPTEEQNLTANTQRTYDETQEITVDAANQNNDVVMSVPDGDNEDNPPTEVGGLQEPSSEEVPAEKINDDEPTTTHEVEFANENTVKANLNENEDKLECPRVNKEVYIESLQVADEDVKYTSSGQDRKSSHLEEQASTEDSHETTGDERYAKTFDSTDLKQETLEDENYATTPVEETKEDSRNQVDDLLMEREEHSVKDSESTSVSDAPKDDITESTLAKEVAEVDDPIDSSQVVTEDIKAFAPYQDTEISSTVEQIIDSKDISSNKITKKTVDARGEETQEAQDTAKSVPLEDDSPNEQDTEATSTKEDLSVELPRIVTEDIEEPCSSEIRETNPREEQIPYASPGLVINDNKQKKTTDPTNFENEIPKNEVPKEMGSVDGKGEAKEEECYLKAVQMTTTIIVVSNQERSLNLTAEETPCTEDLNVNKVILGHIPEVTDDKQKDSPVMKVPEENKMTSNEHEFDGNSVKSEVSEKINDQVDGEVYSCGDKADLEKIEVLNDGPLAVPTSETLAEMESRGRTEAEVKVPNREKEAEFKKETVNDQKNIDTALPNYAVSENVSESKEVNGEEEIASNSSAEILSYPISVASEEVSTSNVTSEDDSTSNTVTHIENKNVQEAPSIKETTPSSAEDQDAESSVEENTYIWSSTKEKSDSNEVAFMPGENKSGPESSNRRLESVFQGQRCDIISKIEEDHKAGAEIQSDKAVTEDILQEETTCEKETMKEEILREKEQLPRIKEGHEDIKEYHQRSYEDEVIKDSHQEDVVMKDQHINSKKTYDFTKNGNDAEMVPEVSEEADEKASEEVEEKIFANEAIEIIFHQEKQATSIEETTAKIDYENPQNIGTACEKTDTQDSNNEAVQAAIIPRGESEVQNKEDEICSSDEVQVNDEKHLILSEGKNKEEANETYKEACVEAKRFDLSHQTKDISECAIGDVGQETPEENEKYTTEKSSGGDDPKTITECEVSSASEDIKLTEQSSENASITAEVQEAKAGIDLGVAVLVPEATGIERQKVEELNDKCTEMADASTPDETYVMTASKTIGESTEGAPLEAKDQQTKDIALTEQLSEGACITAEVQESKDGIYSGASVPVPEATGSEERTETSDGKEANQIQAAPVSETLEHEIEEQKLGRDTVDVQEEETNTSNIPNQLESICVADTEKVPESSFHQSSAENTDQCDQKEENQQIISPLVLPRAQCSDIKTSENKPQCVGGLASADVTELEASPLSLKDKHVVLDADDTRYLILENQDGDKNISTEYSQGEHEVERPSKVEKQREECRNEERKDQQIEGKPESEETGKPSLSDLLQVSTRGTSEMADHSPTEKEPTSHTEDMRAENTGEVEHENMKTDEEKDDEDESHEPKSDIGSEAPVMVDIGDIDIKVAHKKSHNILSGVGSKVKHSIAKVKKAITGKSPKKVTTPESK